MATPVKRRRWKQFSNYEFKADLPNTVLCQDLSWTSSASVNELIDRYSAELSALLNIHDPRYIKKRQRHVLTPWFDTECRDMNVLGGDWRKNTVELVY